MKHASRPIRLMAHWVAGYPTLQKSEAMAKRLCSAGVLPACGKATPACGAADFLEIQFPFSDPVADGPVIAAANAEALRNGFTVKKGFRLVRSIHAACKTPVLIMTYFNIVFRFGVARFCAAAKQAGASGLIIPDYPMEAESVEGLAAACRKESLWFIPVVVPHTPASRLKPILKNASGFVYCVARSGITGSKTVISPQTVSYLKRVRRLTGLPLAVGFGLSKKSQLKALAPHADIAVIGTALIRAYPRERL